MSILTAQGTESLFHSFTEIAGGDPDDAELVAQAKIGHRAALEKLVLRHQAWIYNDDDRRSVGQDRLPRAEGAPPAH